MRRTPTSPRTLADVIGGADIFLGLSAAGVLKPECSRHGEKPLVMALANPTPEIMPDWRGGAAGRDDLHRALGLPNQVNNVLCFPYIFRGALDVRRDRDQRGDEDGGGRAIAALAREAPSTSAARAYGGETPASARTR
jgi:malate dehydrogenase (oxaloacetate-decarboxylating)(NADP+)